MIPHRDILLHHYCRVCDAPLGGKVYLDLGEQPLANAFVAPAEREQPEFTAPLQVALCTTCGLSQLTVVIEPQRLYSRYLFTASTSAPWLAHCAKLVRDYTARWGAHKFVVEIGSNDGALLSVFKEHGHKVLGVEPAQNITERVSVPTLPLFWGADVAAQIAQANGHADLIVATNVLGHVDDARDFLTGVAALLKPSGVALIECPHISPLVMLRAFDTIYHEHLSYWSLGPLERLAEECGLFVFAAEPQAVHGGTMRYWLCPLSAAHFTDSLTSLWKHELRAATGASTFTRSLARPWPLRGQHYKKHSPRPACTVSVMFCAGSTPSTLCPASRKRCRSAPSFEPISTTNLWVPQRVV